MNSFYLQANYTFSTITDRLGRYQMVMEAECFSCMPDESTSSSCQRLFALATALFCGGRAGALLVLPACFASIPSLHWDMKQIFINSFPFHTVATNQKKLRTLGQRKMGCRRIRSSLMVAGPA